MKPFFLSLKEKTKLKHSLVGSAFVQLTKNYCIGHQADRKATRLQKPLDAILLPVTTVMSKKAVQTEQHIQS